MKPWRLAGRMLAFSVVSLLVVVLAPAVLLAGDLVNRHYLGSLRPRRSLARRRRYLPDGSSRRQWRRLARSERPDAIRAGAACRSRRFGPAAHLVISNPFWIALTAPARWLADHLRPRAGSRRRRGGNGPPEAGVREPRRPLPDLPAGAMALPEPGPFH